VTSTTTDQDAVIAALKALEPLARKHGVQVHLSIIPDPEAPPTIHFGEEGRQQKRDDLVWFQALLTDNPDLADKYRGSWVAVYKQKVLGWSASEELVVRLAQHARGTNLVGEDVLMVPVAVSGPEVEDKWSATLHQLGLST